ALDPNATLQLMPGRKRRLAQRGLLASDAQEIEIDGFQPKMVKAEGTGALSKFGIGCVCRKGMKPQSPSQDDFCAFHTDLCTLVGIFDGHGPFGHRVANYVQETLPRTLLQSQAFLHKEVEKAMKDAFVETNQKCLENEAFDCQLSGTTATLAYLSQRMLYIAHVGDSQAVIASKPKPVKGATPKVGIEVEVLTPEHRLTQEGERQRIEAAGGQVVQLEGDIPLRVFLKGELYPGLVITRALGDKIGAKAGVSCEPDVRAVERRPEWQFLLMCSDGVWEFCDFQEAADIIFKYPPSKAQEAAEVLAKEAWERWVKEEGNVVDDITVIVCWLRS
ncbi:unnamed protein product, partial [Symbiodinium sp. KB8]